MLESIRPGPWVVWSLVTVVSMSWATAVEAGLTPVKSPNDDRLYRYITLENRLRVLLVSDASTDKAAAALDVKVGSREDPQDRLGLAHFLEHMLFLGTEKYPEAGAYQAFIQTHGGRHNASTSLENTNYYFEIDRSQLRGALDRFAQFFIGPLFDEDLVDRERNAVHSEYQARLKSDRSRTWDATKSVFNPAHPASRFSIGSAESLANDNPPALRRALQRFWNRYYSAHRMTLVVYGAESLDVLEGWARALFASIVDRGGQVGEVPESVPLVLPGRLPALLEVRPERDVRRLSISFPVPSPRRYYRAKPTYFISNLLGDEGPGSLLSLLKAEGWADGLSAGVGLDTGDSAMFRIHIRLTTEGQGQLAAVVGKVLGAIDEVKASGVNRWRFDEIAHVLDLGFRFQEPASPLDNAVRLAASMHEYPPAEVLAAPYTLTEYDPALIARFLEHLTPENMWLTYEAHGVDTDQRSRYFDAPYALGPLPADWRRAWTTSERDPRLKLPPPNEFLPDSVALHTAEAVSAGPRVVLDEAGLIVVHHQDTSFGVPKANVYVSVRSPHANDTPTHRLLTEMFVRLVVEQLQEFSYPASLAGLDYQLYPHSRGFSLRVSGYDDKLGVLLERIGQTLRHPTIDPAVFAVQLDELTRALANTRKDRSFRLAMREVGKAVVVPRWSEADKLAVVGSLTPAQLEGFVPKLFEAVDLAMLVHGNVVPARARAMAKQVRRQLAAGSDSVRVRRASVVRFDDTANYRRVLDVEHQDSGITVYLQGRSRLIGEQARFALLRQVIASPFYHELRTQQQLGYVVFATGMGMLEVPGIGFVVQSPGTPAPDLEAKIDEFIAGFHAQIAKMSPTEFEQHRAGLRAALLEKDKSLAERSNRYWIEIDRRRLGFDTPQRVVAALEKIEQAGFVDFARRTLAPDGGRRLVVWARGRKHSDQSVAAVPKGIEIIESLAGFKDGKVLFESW